MANFEEMENIAGGIATYSFFKRLTNRYGLLNVLFYGALIVTIIVFSLIYLAGLAANQGHDETWTKVKKGDKLYIFIRSTDTNFTNFCPKRLVRPVNKSDIESMHIAQWKKTKMINELDTTMEPQIINSKVAFILDSMYKYNTAHIGDFIKKDTLKNLGISVDAGGDYWYTIKLDKKHVECCFETEMPKGYVLADKDYYYVPAGSVRLQEPSIFLKNKK